MADRPIELLNWADTGAITNPGAPKETLGWVPSEKPPAEYMNWLQNNFSLWSQYLDTLLNGVNNGIQIQNGLQPIDGSSAGLWTITAGTSINSDGVKWTLAADDVDFNAPAASANAGPSIRIDAIIAKIDPITKVVTLSYFEDNPTFTNYDPANDVIISAILIAVDASYKVLQLQSPIVRDDGLRPHGRLVFSRGVDGSPDIPLNIVEIQDAIDVMSSIGGGVIEITGEFWGHLSGISILLKSGVVIDGISHRGINQGVGDQNTTLFTIQGTTGLTGTAAAPAKGLITSMNKDPNDYGRGSLLVDDGGNEYIIDKIHSVNSCTVVDRVGQEITVAITLTAGKIYIKEAGIKNVGMKAHPDLDSAGSPLVQISNVVDCVFDNNIIDYDYSGAGTGTAQADAVFATGFIRNTTFRNNRIRGDFLTNSIHIAPSSGANDADEIIVSNNIMNAGVVIIDNASSTDYNDFSYRGNVPGGTETINPSGFHESYDQTVIRKTVHFLDLTSPINAGMDLQVQQVGAIDALYKSTTNNVNLELDAAAGSSSFFRFRLAGVLKGTIGINAAGDMFFNDSTAQRMTMAPGGAFGINVLSPVEKLEVGGNIWLTRNGDKLYFSAAKDANISHTGTSFVITNTVGNTFFTQLQAGGDSSFTLQNLSDVAGTTALYHAVAGDSAVPATQILARIQADFDDGSATFRGIKNSKNVFLKMTPDAATNDTAAQINVLGNIPFVIDTEGNTLLGLGALATTAIDGFPHIPVIAGAPTGNPTNKTDFAAMTKDDLNERLWLNKEAGGAADWGYIPTNPVRARYKGSGTTLVANTGVTIVDFSTLDFEDADRVTGTTAWKFTADKDMRLRVSAFVSFINFIWGVDDQANIFLYKGGVEYAQLDKITIGSITSLQYSLQGSTIIDLVATNFIDIRASQNSAGAILLENSPLRNHISIEEI